MGIIAVQNGNYCSLLQPESARQILQNCQTADNNFPSKIALHLKKVCYKVSYIVFRFWPKLTHPAARSLCDQ